MLMVISPAKSLDVESKLATRKHSQPAFLGRAQDLVGVMRQKAPTDLSDLMSISDELAELNFERYQEFETPLSPGNARPAILTFDGDVYRGLGAPSFDERDFTHAQKTLRILSGLYGLLRPLDLIQPYRLEMGTRLRTDKGRDLYEFWGNDITDALTEAVAASPGPAVLINLASQEYFNSVKVDRLSVPVVAPVFLDHKPGVEPKVISFFAKRARGLMARWVIQGRVKSVRALEGFDADGYRFDPRRSTRTNPTFVREY